MSEDIRCHDGGFLGIRKPKPDEKLVKIAPARSIKMIDGELVEIIGE